MLNAIYNTGSILPTLSLYLSLQILLVNGGRNVIKLKKNQYKDIVADLFKETPLLRGASMTLTPKVRNVDFITGGGTVKSGLLLIININLHTHGINGLTDTHVFLKGELPAIIDSINKAEHKLPVTSLTGIEILSAYTYVEADTNPTPTALVTGNSDTSTSK